MVNPVNNMPPSAGGQMQQGQQGMQMSPSQQMALARQLMNQQNRQQQARSPLEALGNTMMQFQRQQQLQNLNNQGGGSMSGGAWGNGLLSCSRAFKTNRRPVSEILPGV